MNPTQNGTDAITKLEDAGLSSRKLMRGQANSWNQLGKAPQ
jgi:hypothetical protein